MKTYYKWFDYFLNLLLVSTLIVCGITVYLFAQNNSNIPAWNSYLGKEGGIITLLLLALFIFGLLYVVLGTILFGINRRKNPENVALAKSMVIKGLFRSIFAFILFVILSLALSFFGLGMPSSQIPRIVDEDVTDGFPLKDLKIVNVAVVKPQISGDWWSCDVTVKNTNSSFTAADIYFSQGGTDTEDDTFQNRSEDISPGSSKTISVTDVDQQKPCSSITIAGASTLHK